MYEVKEYKHDKSQNKLFLYFDTEENYKEVKRFFARQQTVASYVDNRDFPLSYTVFKDDAKKTLLIKDNEHAKSPGQGVQTCLDYLIQCEFIQVEPTPSAEAAKIQHPKSH